MVHLDWMIVFRLGILISGFVFLSGALQFGLQKWHPKTNQIKTVRTLIQSAFRYLFAIVGIFWGLAILGVDVAALLAGAGIVALVIGFGAESLIADVITGIFMIFEHQYDVGDIIVVGDFRGTVTQIGIRTTSIIDVGGNTKIINNSDVRNLINRSSDRSRAVCDIAIPARDYLELAEKTILDEAEKLHTENPGLFPELPQYLGVQKLDFKDNTVILRVSAGVEEDSIFTAQRVMNRAMLVAFETAGIPTPAGDQES